MTRAEQALRHIWRIIGPAVQKNRKLSPDELITVLMWIATGLDERKKENQK